MCFVMINITFPSGGLKENDTNEAETTLTGPELSGQGFPLRLCAFAQTLSLNKYGNLLSVWESPSTD